MIRGVNPELAAFNSIYGFPFSAPPPLAYRLKTAESIHRPPWLRRLTYRLKREPSVRPQFLGDDHLGTVLDIDTPYMRHLFRLDRVGDPSVFNRIMTIEYLCQKFGAQLPENS